MICNFIVKYCLSHNIVTVAKLLNTHLINSSSKFVNNVVKISYRKQC